MKTAAQLIQEFGDLDTLLARAGEIKQQKRRETLIAFADQIRLSRELVRLKCDVALEAPLEALEVREPDPERAAAVPGASWSSARWPAGSRRSSGWRRHPSGAPPGGIEPPRGGADVAARSPAPGPRREVPREVPAIDHGRYVVIREVPALEDWMARIRDAGLVAFGAETTSLDEMRAELVGIALWPGAGRGGLRAGRARGGATAISSTAGRRAEGQIAPDEALALLKPVLEDPGVLKVAQNMKAAAKLLARLGARVAPIDDVLLISYALACGAARARDGYLSEPICRHVPVPLKSVLGSGTGGAGCRRRRSPRRRSTRPSTPRSRCGSGRR